MLNPGLVCLTLSRIKQDDLSLTKILTTPLGPESIYQDYLQRQLRSLQPYADLIPLAAKIMNADGPVAIEALQAIRLESLGLIKVRGSKVVPSCQLHRQYFGAALGEA